MPSEDDVELLTSVEEDVAEAGDVLGWAYSETPTAAMVFKDASGADALGALQGMFRGLVSVYSDDGGHSSDINGSTVGLRHEGKLAAVAVTEFFLDGPPGPLSEMGKHRALQRAVKKNLPATAAHNMRHLMKLTRRQRMPGMYIHVVALGVDLDHRRQGLGARLMAHTARQADGFGMACTCEADSEESLEFLKHLGYVVVQHRYLHPQKMPLWFMLRPAKPL